MPTYYKRNVNPTNNNWNQADNWSTVSSTSSTNSGTFPSSTTLDPVIFDSSSVGVTVNVNSVCTTLTTTGFNGTITLTGTLSTNGNVTIGSGTTFGGSSNLIMNANGTLDVASGTTIPNLQFGNTGGATFTLARSTTVTNLTKGGAFTSTVNAGSGGTLLNVTNGNVRSTAGTLAMGTNVTLTINGSSSLGGSGSGLNFAGGFNLASGSTLSLSGTLLTNGATATYNFSSGTLVNNNQLFSITNTSNVTVNLGSNSFYDMNVSGSIGLTLQSNINIIRNLTTSGNNLLSGAFDITVGGNIITASAGFTNFTSGRKITVTGTANGTSIIGGFGFAASTAANNYTLEVDCGSNNVIMSGSSIILNAGTAIFNYLPTNSGTFNATGHTFIYSSGNLSINMNGSSNSLGTIQNGLGVSRALTLLSDVTCVNYGPTSSSDFLNGSGYFLNVSSGATSINNISGTGNLRFVSGGTSNFSHVAGTTNGLNSIHFAKTSGSTLNIPNNFTYSTANGLITYSSGTINHTSTLSISSSVMTLNTPSVNWLNISVLGTSNIILNAPLIVTNNLTLAANGNVTFSGTSGWNCANLLCSTANRTITLQEGLTYNTSNNANMLGTDAQRIFMTSSSPSNRAIWTLAPAATQSMIYVNGTRIDSSLGQTIWSFGPPVLTDTINWNSGSRPQGTAHTFIY